MKNIIVIKSKIIMKNNPVTISKKIKFEISYITHYKAKIS